VDLEEKLARGILFVNRVSLTFNNQVSYWKLEVTTFRCNSRLGGNLGISIGWVKGTPPTAETTTSSQFVNHPVVSIGLTMEKLGFFDMFNHDV
jgi:hypothetical protein